MTPMPTEVRLDRDGRKLEITWEDAHASTYGLRYLRGFCPCAHCQGHAKSVWTFNPVDDPMVTEISELGNYALSIVFSDGHDSGIYSFDILRELCPCDACQAEHGDGHAVHSLPTDDPA